MGRPGLSVHDPLRLTRNEGSEIAPHTGNVGHAAGAATARLQTRLQIHAKQAVGEPISAPGRVEAAADQMMLVASALRVTGFDC